MSNRKFADLARYLSVQRGAESDELLQSGLKVSCAKAGIERFRLSKPVSCGPHGYLEPPQPLPPAGFSTFISSLIASTASSAFFSASSSTASAASAASSVFSSTTSAAFSTAFSALPALGLAPQALPPAACAAGMVMLPELTKAATPRPARSFFRSLLSILCPPCSIVGFHRETP
jgi:hypothetical protein